MLIKKRTSPGRIAAFLFALVGVAAGAGQGNGSRSSAARPQGPCDIYAAAGDPCVAAHSTTRALYAAYNGPLYQVLRQSDGKTLDIGVVQPGATPSAGGGGYANAAAQDAFCAHTYCWIAVVYDQSPKHNDLTQAPRGAFLGPAMGGFNNLPLADMAPVSIMGHKVYGVFIAPGMGLRNNDTRGTAVDDQAEGQYWVINGLHFNSGCCFDYGNAEIDSRDDNNGTMETAYYGDSTGWYHGNAPGPWIMTDQENNLVGCVNPDGSKLCASLPNISWRFVTAMAKGEPHHWTSLGGDAQGGSLSVMFDGPRIDLSYDPMRKQGAILLGNGGDNSNSSQGTFYEGAMTAAGTFPKDATDQLVQANVVAARYAAQPVSLSPAAATTAPTGLQVFSPGGSQDTTVTFTNVTGAPVKGVVLSVALPDKRWSASIDGARGMAKTFAETVAPGSSLSATFKITAGPAAFNGDLLGSAAWTESTGAKGSDTAAEKVRSGSAVKINEFRAGGANPTHAFVELYNAGSAPVDLSSWSLTLRAAQAASFSAVKIPAGKKLAPGSFYLLGLAASGLAVPARAGDATLPVRSVTGMSVGDTVTIDTGALAETRKLAKLGSAAGASTTLWQPLPDGPVMTVPAGSSNVPVTSVAGFAVGEKIALGYGATYPVVARGLEQYEVATVTAVGKPGTQAFLGVDARAGETNLKVTSVANITAGDKIRLDIDSVGHGVETVTVTRVGTQASRTTLAKDAAAGVTNIKVRGVNNLAVGDKVVLGTPANQKTYTLTAVGTPGPAGTGLEFTPAFAEAHSSGEDVVSPGTGLDLAAPLRFAHAANLPFSDRGTGISFQPATAFAHGSNEPVQPLGTGLTLDSPLAKEHPIDAVVEDSAVKTAGYQGTPAPDQWFGGPVPAVTAGSVVLRDAVGLVVDSMNYGGLVDPWAAQGYQAKSGPAESGCFAPSPGFGGFGGFVPAGLNRSVGRFPDGADTGSNCLDFQMQATGILAAAAEPGATNLKVGSVAGFRAGQTLRIDGGASAETATIASVGTAGATTLEAATNPGATALTVMSTLGFNAGQTITIGHGAEAEAGVIATATRTGRAPVAGGARITLVAPLTRAHAAGGEVAGSGITLGSALRVRHERGAEISDNVPTPGAPNRYTRRSE